MIYRFSFSFEHHGRYSSYHRLLHYAGGGPACFDATRPAIRRLPGEWPLRVEWRWLRWAERRAWHRARDRGAQGFHYLYPENTCYRGERWKGNTPVLVSCHQPASYLEANWDRPALDLLRNSLRMADAVAVLAPSEIDRYRELTPHARVEFVPHGIDTEWFSPGGRQPGSDRIRVLTVGNWLRDYETWAAVVRLAAERRLPLTFQILASGDTLRKATAGLDGRALEKVEVLQGIDDAALRELYRKATVSFLPLHGATANNALLESLACGVPLVVTDLPATRAYAGEGAEYVPGGNAGEALRRIEQIAASPERALKLGEAAREVALRDLAWPAVVDRLDRLIAP